MSEQNPGNRFSGDRPSIRQTAAGVLLASAALSTGCMPSELHEHSYSFLAQCPPNAPHLDNTLSIHTRELWNSSVKIDVACIDENHSTTTEPLAVTEIRPHDIDTPSRHVIRLVVASPVDTYAHTSTSQYNFNITVASSQLGVDLQFREGSIDDKKISYQQISPLGDQP